MWQSYELSLYLVMAFDEHIANRIREALAPLPDVEEKKMFHGICFMVNGKMCLCVRLDEMLCRIGPHKYGEALEMSHCRPMIHNGRTMTGFVFVSNEGIRKKKDFEYWVKLALEFNKEAKAAKKAVKKKK
jgi:TfoX/Sxy family transcriptional regulator of competence genes